jgi:hypothetical protein
VKESSHSPIEDSPALHKLVELKGGIQARNQPKAEQMTTGTTSLHWHLPQLERLGDALVKLDVLARQKIDLTAPPHPFTRDRTTFDALLQSRPEICRHTSRQRREVVELDRRRRRQLAQTVDQLVQRSRSADSLNPAV